MEAHPVHCYCSQSSISFRRDYSSSFKPPRRGGKICSLPVKVALQYDFRSFEATSPIQRSGSLEFRIDSLIYPPSIIVSSCSPERSEATTWRPMTRSLTTSEVLKVVLISSCTGTCIGSILVCCYRVVNKDLPFVAVHFVASWFLMMPASLRCLLSHLCLKRRAVEQGLLKSIVWKRHVLSVASLRDMHAPQESGQATGKITFEVGDAIE
jgi:hypothetical protein